MFGYHAKIKINSVMENSPHPNSQKKKKKKKEREKEIENKKSSPQMKIDYSSDIDT